MAVSRTFSLYIARVFVASIVVTFVICLVAIYIADLSELLRRASSDEAIGFFAVATMAIFKLPGMGERLLPFAVLIGSMYAFQRLSRRHELVVARAVGVSVWQFVAPACAAVLAIGVVVVVAYNPLAAYANSVYEKMEAELLRSSAKGIFGNWEDRLWLRQANADGAAVMRASKAVNRGLELRDVMVLQLGHDETFLARSLAERAVLEPGRWRLENAWVTGPDGVPAFSEEYWVDTSLSSTQISESLSSPSAISFWDLPKFIAIAEQAGLSARRYRVHYHVLLAQPVLFFSMVLVAATFSLRLLRLGNVTRMIVAGLAVGFALFVISQVSYALGGNGTLPPVLAAWSPVVFTVLATLSILFYQEDG